MVRFVRLAASVLVACLTSPGAPRDPSSHTVRFVSVDHNIRLEVLDWGGSGRPVVLLAGGGDTAHVFDDFAPKLTAEYHVYGITRRGFGASDFAVPQNPADRLGDDVATVLETLKLSGAVLVAHSFAGEELSSVAARHPDRVAGLVYLEAMYPYAFDNGRGPAMKEILDLSGPQPPPPGASDVASVGSLRSYYVRVLGFPFPTGELLQQWDFTADGKAGKHRDFPGGAVLYTVITTGMKKYTTIPRPALVIFANPHSQGTWVDQNQDPVVRRAADTYSAQLVVVINKQIRAFREGVPAARVMILPGANHYVYLSNEEDVLREMRSFLAGLH